LPGAEWEWVLVYAFYATNFGQKDITREEITKYYVNTKRDAKQNINNLTQNLNSINKKGYINFLNEADFQMLDNGIEEAIKIISRTSSSNTNTGKKGKVVKPKAEGNQKVKKSNKLEKISDLNLAPDNNISIKIFYEQHPVKTHNDKILLFVYYLEEVLKINISITYNHIYTCYDWLNLAFPEAFVQAVADTKKKGWIEGKDKTGFKTSLKGKNHFKQKKHE
jgi:hypothetical protein